MLIRIAQYMQETWGSHHVLKRGGALQRVKNDLKSIIVKPSPKKGCWGRLCEVVVYKRFQLSGFDCGFCWIESHLQKVGGCT